MSPTPQQHNAWIREISDLIINRTKQNDGDEIDAIMLLQKVAATILASCVTPQQHLAAAGLFHSQLRSDLAKLRRGEVMA